MKNLDSAVVTIKAEDKLASCFAVHIKENDTSYINLCNWDEDVVYNGDTYTKNIPIKAFQIYSSYIAGGTISLGNIDGSFTSLLINGTLKNQPIDVYEIYFDDNNDVVGAETLYSGIVGGQDIRDDWYIIRLRPFSDNDIVLTPRRRIVPSCGFVFKGDDCAYSGGESYCPKTFEKCFNNGKPFGGFRFIPKSGKTFSWGNIVVTVK